MRVTLYEDDSGHEPVAEYLEELARSGQVGTVVAYRRARDLLERTGPLLGLPHSRLIDRRRRVYELRFGAHRVAYAFVGNDIVLLHAWRKHGQKLDVRELATALRRLEELVGS